MKRLLEPAVEFPRRSITAWTLVLLLASCLAVFAAPSAMPDGYVWRVHSISESAAQGLHNGWIARLGLACFGAAVLLLAIARRSTWPRAAYWMHLTYSACMVAAAVFSHKPWIAGAPSDEFEDLLHSIAATGMGFAFSFGVAACLIRREAGQLASRVLDFVALGSATIIPMAMINFPANAGLVQRAMFVVSYGWYGLEAIHALRTRGERSNGL